MLFKKTGNKTNLVKGTGIALVNVNDSFSLRGESKPNPANQRAISGYRPGLSRVVWAWAFYDFANSPFSTTITTVVFNVYFAQVVAAGAPYRGDSIWAFLVGTSTLISALIAPLLGALADLTGRRRGFLAACAGLGSAATFALVASGPGTLPASALLFLAASLCFASSLTLYNAYLNDLAGPEEFSRVSGFGWALGYIGGGLCLALNLVMIRRPGLFGIPDADHWPVRLCFAVVGLWWAVFSLPLLLSAPPDSKQPALWRRALLEAVNRIGESLDHARKFDHQLWRFLLAYLFYNDGIETVIVMAGVFGSQVLGMSPSEIVLCFLMIQFTAFAGSLLFGWIGARVGDKKALQISLIIWIAATAWAVTMRNKAEFWAAGALIAVVLGGSQALSRSLFARFVPKSREAEYYGFFSLSSKAAAALGPLAYGVCLEITGSPRLAILSMLLFFSTGFILLHGIKTPEISKDAYR